MVDADMPMHTPPSPEVCGLQIRCAWLEVRLGVEEMQGGTPGEQKQFGATEEKDISQREVWYSAPGAKGTESWGPIANRVTCCRKFCIVRTQLPSRSRPRRTLVGEALSYSRGEGTWLLQWDGAAFWFCHFFQDIYLRASCQPRRKGGALFSPLPPCRVGWGSSPSPYFSRW